MLKMNLELGIRHLQIFFLCALLIISTGMRVQLSVAIVAITEQFTSPNPDVPVYNWPNKSLILSSFFWGYVIFQIAAGNLGRLYGTKYLLIGAMLANATACCLIPVSAEKFGSYGVMVCAFVEGLAQGFYFPAIYIVLSKWCPISELGTLCTFALSGGLFGIVIGMPLVGFISSSWGGWPLSFYLYAGLGYLWAIFYYFYGANSPSSCPNISHTEKKLIESNLKSETNKTNVPWKGIFTNIPFWSIFAMQVATTCSFQTLISELPNYMNKIMKFDIKSNSILCATPYLASFLLLILFGRLADYIINREILSLLQARKMFTAIGSLFPCISLLILSFLPADAIVSSIMMLVTAIGVGSANSVGCGINHIDLSPNFSGVILGIINSCSNFCSIFGPTAVHFIVEDEEDKSQWRIIFLIGALLYVIPLIFYLIFASTEVQAFDSLKIENIHREKTDKLSKG